MLSIDHPHLADTDRCFFKTENKTKQKRRDDEAAAAEGRRQISRSEVCYIFERKDLDVDIFGMDSLSLSLSTLLRFRATRPTLSAFFCCTFFSVEISLPITKSKFRFCWMLTTLSRLFVFFANENNRKTEKLPQKWCSRVHCAPRVLCALRSVSSPGVINRSYERIVILNSDWVRR